MGLFKNIIRKQINRQTNQARNINQIVGLLMNENNCISIPGYVSLSQNPEVQAAVNYIAELVSSMTIYLMENTKKGDIRVKDELAKKIDISPNRNVTRKPFIYSIVKKMLLEGNAFVLPQTKNGLLENLEPLSNASIVDMKDGSFSVVCNGKTYKNDEILNFIVNPDIDRYYEGKGYTVELKSLVSNLTQAMETKKSFMSSKWLPPLIVKVDALTEEFSSPKGREKLLKEYIETNERGQPWILPAENFDVEQVRPLSLNDIAINESVEIDKKTVARIIGVPLYAVGVGNFNKDEYRHFIDTKIKSIAEILAQEFTDKLLLSPKRYFMFSPKSLYGYDLTELGNLGMNLYVRGLIDGNEVRSWVNLSPREGLDKLVMLENYIPADMIGEQKKLKGND